MRRIAEARPVKDAVAERVIIEIFPGFFLARPWDRVMGDRRRWRVSLHDHDRPEAAN